MVTEIKVWLPDGSSRSVPAGTTTADLAAEIGRRLAAASVAAEVDGTLVDLSEPLTDGARVRIITAETRRGPRRPSALDRPRDGPGRAPALARSALRHRPGHR